MTLNKYLQKFDLKIFKFDANNDAIKHRAIKHRKKPSHHIIHPSCCIISFENVKKAETCSLNQKEDSMNSLCVLSVLLLTETSSGFVFPAKTISPNIINTQQISSSSSTTSIYSALKEDEQRLKLLL